ncbi:MAG: endonuclease domain-containing protein [Alphaproteobacteria bacterium]
MPSHYARRLRKNPTGAEHRLWARLRRRQLDGCQFRRQAPIGLYIVDFVCFSRRLVVELDGGQHARRLEADARRTSWLESEGFQVVRFWNNQVLENTEGVVEIIVEVLRARDGLSFPTGAQRRGNA